LVLGAVSFVFVPLVAPNAAAAEGGEERELQSPYSSPAEFGSMVREMEQKSPPLATVANVTDPAIWGGPPCDPHVVRGPGSAFATSLLRQGALPSSSSGCSPSHVRRPSGRLRNSSTDVTRAGPLGPARVTLELESVSRRRLR
jgi:hypothetical protein